MVYDPDAGARRDLLRYKALATSLLLIMAALVIASYALPQGVWANLLGASAKAGFVGGIADWFAVTALFRHPLGLPIPHTAIIATQKARLGRALGRFIAGHVITPAEVSRVLEQLNVSAIVSRFLMDREASRPAAVALTDMLPRIFATVEDGRARRIVARLSPRLLGGPAAGTVIARALRSLVDSGRHQELLSFIVVEFRKVLDAKQGTLHQFVQDKVRAQGGKLVGWMLGAQLADRVLTVLRTELDRVSNDGHSLHQAFDVWVRQELDRIETDPARAAEIGEAVRRAVAHERIQAWLWEVWTRLRQTVADDVARPNGRTLSIIEGTFTNLGSFLAEDEAARTRLQHAAEGIIATLLPSAQAQVSNFIAEVVANWDADTIVDKIELRVGKDLQYVRVNGTIVGFLVGGCLFLLLRMIFGPGVP